MLTSLILNLQTPADVQLPATLGRAGHALLLRLIAGRDSNLAEELHTAAGLKPFTVSNLVMGQRAGGKLQLKAGQTGWLRFTGLTAPVSRHLQEIAAQPPDTVEMDGRSLTVAGVTLDPNENAWAGQISYQELASPYLLGGQDKPGRKIQFEFASPTTFRSQGRYVPVPLPELVFGSLLDRWQAFAPIALSPDVRRLAAEAVALTRYQTRTRSMPSKGGGIRIGFTGQVTFAPLTHDRYWLNVLHLLAAFAFYSGVGYQTTAGLGQTRPIQ